MEVVVFTSEVTSNTEVYRRWTLLRNPEHGYCPSNPSLWTHIKQSQSSSKVKVLRVSRRLGMWYIFRYWRCQFQGSYCSNFDRLKSCHELGQFIYYRVLGLRTWTFITPGRLPCIRKLCLCPLSLRLGRREIKLYFRQRTSRLESNGWLNHFIEHISVRLVLYMTLHGLTGGFLHELCGLVAHLCAIKSAGCAHSRDHLRQR